MILTKVINTNQTTTGHEIHEQQNTSSSIITEEVSPLTKDKQYKLLQIYQGKLVTNDTQQQIIDIDILTSEPFDQISNYPSIQLNNRALKITNQLKLKNFASYYMSSNEKLNFGWINGKNLIMNYNLQFFSKHLYQTKSVAKIQYSKTACIHLLHPDQLYSIKQGQNYIDEINYKWKFKPILLFFLTTKKKFPTKPDEQKIEPEILETNILLNKINQNSISDQLNYLEKKAKIEKFGCEQKQKQSKMEKIVDLLNEDWTQPYRPRHIIPIINVQNKKQKDILFQQINYCKADDTVCGFRDISIYDCYQHKKVKIVSTIDQKKYTIFEQQAE